MMNTHHLSKSFWKLLCDMAPPLLFERLGQLPVSQLRLIRPQGELKVSDLVRLQVRDHLGVSLMVRAAGYHTDRCHTKSECFRS